jgi:hypothetical protein|tara:strand:+ start:320 stop:619 length:300 start_codon:yes stop_codon:yes gene_type:complete
MGFELRTLDIDDLSVAQKTNVRYAASIGEGNVLSEDKPLAGVTSEQRTRNKNVGDVLNIGAGTRCKHCGFLHFMWRETCGACEKPMEYNMSHRDEEARL